MTEAILMREGPNEQKKKTREQRTENKIGQKPIFKKKQLPFK